MSSNIRCNTCREYKSVTDYIIGYRKCRECCNALKRAWYWKNRASVREKENKKHRMERARRKLEEMDNGLALRQAFKEVENGNIFQFDCILIKE